MTQQRVIVLLGSADDFEFAAPIRELLGKFKVDFEFHVASAHKDSQRLIEMLEKYERLEDQIVYLTIAGMSNALSGFVDFKTRHPVIACPRLEEVFCLVDIYSSLRMPRGVAPLVVLNPENAGLAAIKILGETNRDLADGIRQMQADMQSKNKEADERIRNQYSRSVG